ncbi:asparagine-linked glycosylation protein [Nowakowskiella sp. JEL0407]|nr:asparagine-linked glycosylation protein [Nowakowskiella sp. JEL0407]
MFLTVQSQTASFNNSNTISSNTYLSKVKLYYYYFFAGMYGFVGSFADVVMVNSKWTKAHVETIFWTWEMVLDKKRDSKGKIVLVYPPCNVSELMKINIERGGKEEKKIILSVGQFRPEKAHAVQIRSFHKFITSHKEFRGRVKLCLIGGCRNAEDEQRVEDLQALCEELGLTEDVRILRNVPFDILVDYYQRSWIGLHTMWNEHFGIGVVEYMAAGLIPLAHNSGGPKSDIIVNRETNTDMKTGYLASTVDEFSDKMYEILTLPMDLDIKIRKSARESVREQFSDDQFTKGFIKCLNKVL